MNEDLLQFLWKFKCFKVLQLQSVEGLKIQLINTGMHNTDEGPDFLEAELIYDSMRWKGPIELHMRSTDWERHGHEHHPLYKNLIAHVVYEHDQDIPYFVNKKIPTIELKPLINPESIDIYRQLQYSPATIACEESIAQLLDQMPFTIYYEQWLLEKWHSSAKEIIKLYHAQNNHWEATIWIRIAYVLGLKINAKVYTDLIESLSFEVVQKTAENEKTLLALIHGKAGLLDSQKDEFQSDLKKEYDYLLHKFQINSHQFFPNFFRLRPPAFPTIRLALWVNMRHQFPNFFQEIMYCNHWKDIQEKLSEIRVFPYFNTHWVYGSPAQFSEKKLSPKLAQSLMINAILPIQYAYSVINQQDSSSLIEILYQMPKEQNSILNQFEKLGFLHENALHSQALLQLHKKYCSKKKCLLCSIGLQIMKK